jgi:phage shock protein A
MTPEQEITKLRKTVDQLSSAMMVLLRRVSALEKQQRHIKSRQDLMKNTVSSIEHKTRG